MTFFKSARATILRAALLGTAIAVDEKHAQLDQIEQRFQPRTLFLAARQVVVAQALFAAPPRRAMRSR